MTFGFRRAVARCLATTLAALLTGCGATFVGPPPLTTVPPAKNFATVSMMGTQFHGIRVATLVFGNLFWDAEVPEWEIDHYAEKVLADHLRKRPGYSGAPLELTEMQRQEFLRSRSAWTGYDRKMYPTHVRTAWLVLHRLLPRLVFRES